MVSCRYPRSEVDQESKYLKREGNATRRESVFYTSQLDLNWEEGIGPSVPWPVEPIGQCLDRFTNFDPKTMFFNFAWTCEKFAQTCEMNQGGFWLQLKGRSENWFRMTMRNALRRQNWCWCILHFAQSCELVGARAKLYFLQIPWWRSFWKTS